MSEPYLRAAEGGIELDVLVQPRASRTRLCGEHDGRMKVQLAAPPVDGEANEELLRFLAGVFGVPRRQLSLRSGETSRRKRVRVVGIDVALARAAMTCG